MVKTAEKKKRKSLLTKQQRRYLIATVIVLLSLLGLSITFMLRVYFMTESSCYEKLAVETEEAISDLEANLRSDRTTLRVMAGLIGNADDIDSIEVAGYLTNYDYNNLITQIGMLFPGDELMSSKNKRSTADGVTFEQESALGEHISGLQPSAANPDATVIRSYVPIRKDGICIGLLYSAASPSSIAKAWIPGVYDKNGYCYVVNRKTGEIIINTTTDQIKDIHDIAFTQSDSSYTKEGTIQNILDGKKGYSVFSSAMTSEKLYMCYLPFSIEDWEMVVFVPESVAFSDVTPIRKGMYALFAAAALIITVYSLWLIRSIRISIAETEQKANIDALTALPNRNRYEAFLKKLEGSGERLTCLFIDANGLHELNNSKGHFAGDKMLRFIADTLKVQFGGEHIYRIGGDEFVVFLSGKTEAELEEMLTVFHKTLEKNDYYAAVGTCEYGNGMSVNQMIGTAEKDMYAEKQKYYDQIGKIMRA